MNKWYKLDNIGTFYAFTSNKKIPKVFRYSAYLKDEIDETILQNALNNTLKTFPNFNVNLKRGFYWYYLNETNKKNKVTKENLPICFKIYNNSDDFLYRVSYFKNKINLEISHILSDGRGSIEFFKYLIENYASLKYSLKTMPDNNNSALEKSEDSFLKYYHRSKLPKQKHDCVYLYKGSKYHHETRFLDCHLALDEVLNLAHKYKTTLTCFLVSVLIYSFKNELKTSELNKAIRIDIPVDLRTFFPSNTSMNFFGLTSISYKFSDKGVSLESIIASVREKFTENINAEKLCERANLMVSFERNWFCRLAPIFVKDIVLNVIDRFTMNASTTCISNIGKVEFNKETSKYVDNISVFTSTENFQFTVCSYQNKLNIGISNNFVNNDIIKNFCRYFSNQNIKIDIDVSEVKE